MSDKLVIHGIDVYVEGTGSETIVMIHGWPDTYRLWDDQVKLLKNNFKCVRFTLPGFDITKERKLYTLKEEIAIFGEIIDAVSPDKPVILMAHDWGCFFGYQYYMNNQKRVSKIIGMDIGDVDSKNMKLPFKMVMFTMCYQLWLALAWNIGGKTGDNMTRWLAKKFKVKGDISLIWSGMNYGYHLKWKHLFLRKSQGTILFNPKVPMLFLFGKTKPTMFHSQIFVDRLNKTQGSRAVGFDAGHWVMLDNKLALEKEITEWLDVKTKPAAVKEAASKKPAAKKPAVKKAVAPKKPAAKKAPAKKAAPKAAAKKPAAKKAAPKAAVKKAAAPKKPAAKKAPAKKK